MFLSPARILLIGPSQSGKTHLINQVIIQKDKYFGGEPIKQIIYCYQSKHSIASEIKNIPNIKFFQGYPSIDEIENNSLIFLDDLQISDLNSDIVKLFTIYSHHKKLSVILPVHYLFAPNAFLRTISSNATHLIVFKSPRYSNTFSLLAKQLTTANNKELVKIFNNLTESSPYAHFCIDLTPNVSEFYRYKSNILNETAAECYVTKNCLSKLEQVQLPDGQGEVFFGPTSTRS